MRFLVFIPQAKGPVDFRAVGLECLTGEGETAPEMTETDSFPPAGCAGRIYGWPQGMDGRPGYLDHLQTWIPAAPDPDRNLPAKRYWLGLWNESPPTEGDLAKPRQVSGRMRIKASSGKWLIPSLLNLPCALELDESSGLPVRIPKPEHDAWRADCAWGTALVLRLINSDVELFPLHEAFEVCVRILQLNYRLPRELVHRLGLLADETILHSIMSNAADPAEIHAAIDAFESKKNGPPTADS